jgi:hypothetical protein
MKGEEEVEHEIKDLNERRGEKMHLKSP